MARRVNGAALALIQQWEGLRLDAYQDIGGIWTIGYGSTTGVTAGMRITEAEATERLRRDLATAEAAVERAVKVDLTDNQFGALVSLVFNIGAGAFRSSSLLRRLNAGDYDSVPAEMARWNKVGGKVVRGLANRRAAEAGLWAKGSFVASRSVEPQDGLSAKEAARTGTGKAAVGVGAAGVLSTVSQHSDAISALGLVGPAIGIAVVVAAVVLFILRRRGHI
jgi:GH24 family phage-related lysozyme (muramidase)